MMKLFLQLLIVFNLFGLLNVPANENRWVINGEKGISWQIKANESHQDNIEMSGRFVSAVIHYGVNADGSFYIKRDVVFPMLRTVPNDTHASLIRSFGVDVAKMISINGRFVAAEKVSEIQLNGKIIVKSSLTPEIDLERTFFPSTTKPVFCEKYVITNKGTKPVFVEIPVLKSVVTTPAEKGVEGNYELRVKTLKGGEYKLAPNSSAVFYQTIDGGKKGSAETDVDVEEELIKRQKLVGLFQENLILETPDAVLNQTFAFAKIRAAESIYQTKGGAMHGPGGLRYYAAIWANDQAEYINPFFPYLGYDYGVESALNSYRHFARFMNSEFKPIPSSIVAEGLDIWNGAGDRGDAAMIAYGAARFALSQGDRKTAEELWTLIEWCLEFNKRKLNAAGVVASDSDELEGRLPAGKANLNTSALYYDALLSTVYLGKSLGKDEKQLTIYKSQAEILRKNIENYFRANVMGFDTYRYYDGNDVLRAWIATPLTVDIFDRKQGTIDALFSPKLWTEDGLASQSGQKTFWDRSTLYGLRGVFAAGERKRGLEYLQKYSNRRLLGNHVPYAVEAFPEGNQRHLSAESGLYCRIFTEGLFGIRPTGLDSFTITPQLPDEWNFMRLKKVSGFGRKFDIEVLREGKQVRLKVTDDKKPVFNKLIKIGTGYEIKF